MFSMVTANLTMAVFSSVCIHSSFFGKSMNPKRLVSRITDHSPWSSLGLWQIVFVLAADVVTLHRENRTVTLRLTQNVTLNIMSN